MYNWTFHFKNCSRVIYLIKEVYIEKTSKMLKHKSKEIYLFEDKISIV